MKKTPLMREIAENADEPCWNGKDAALPPVRSEPLLDGFCLATGGTRSVEIMGRTMTIGCEGAPGRPCEKCKAHIKDTSNAISHASERSGDSVQ